jgi:tetraacyldisaccharide 4'-kinase
MVEKHWYSRKKTVLSSLLQPVSSIFSYIANSRKIKQQASQFKSLLPVIVVGNISVGGTGKTPVVRAICEYYLSQGNQPAIVSRGYGAKSDIYPFSISKDTKPTECGDEPYMMYDALSGKVPIVIDADRSNAIKFIEKNHQNVDVIISDDGLQHYKMARDFEIAVVDSTRMFGNEMCIPAGPLREPIGRIKSVDMVLAVGNIANDDKKYLLNLNSNSVFTKIIPKEFVNIKTGQKIGLEHFYEQDIVAIAGIGNPMKFFNSLIELKCKLVLTESFKDHHKFVEADFTELSNDLPLIMTYKDAVKCKDFASDNWWYLDIGLDVDFSFLSKVIS